MDQIGVIAHGDFTRVCRAYCTWHQPALPAAALIEPQGDSHADVHTQSNEGHADCRAHNHVHGRTQPGCGHEQRCGCHAIEQRSNDPVDPDVSPNPDHTAYAAL